MMQPGKHVHLLTFQPGAQRDAAPRPTPGPTPQPGAQRDASPDARPDAAILLVLIPLCCTDRYIDTDSIVCICT